MSSEQVVTDGTAEAPSRRGPERRPSPSVAAGCPTRWFLLIGGVIVVNIVALILVPPFPKDGAPGEAVRVSRLLHQRHARVPGAAHGHRA